MSGGFVTVERFEAEIRNLKNKIRAKHNTGDLTNAQRVVQKARTVLTLTWDNTVRTLDLTGDTSATARWALIHVWAERAADFTDEFFWFYYNETANHIVRIASNQIGTENYQISGCCWLPLDSEQRINYKAPANTNNVEVILFGYMEPL